MFDLHRVGAVIFCLFYFLFFIYFFMFIYSFNLIYYFFQCIIFYKRKKNKKSVGSLCQ